MWGEEVGGGEGECLRVKDPVLLFWSWEGPWVLPSTDAEILKQANSKGISHSWFLQSLCFAVSDYFASPWYAFKIGNTTEEVQCAQICHWWLWCLQSQALIHLLAVFPDETLCPPNYGNEPKIKCFIRDSLPFPYPRGFVCCPSRAEDGGEMRY